ncbi:hypothetical protein ACFX1T_010013 [Malus domestica]
MALVIAEEPDIALSLFDEISSAHWLVPDSVTFSFLLRCYCGEYDLDGARGGLIHMVENGFYPDPATFTVLVNSLCKRGKLRGLWSLLHGLFKWRKIRNAIRVYEEMVENGFEVEERLMNNLVRGLCRRSWKEKNILEDAHQLFKRMRSGHSGIDASTYGLMIQSLCMGKKVDEALVSLQGMVRTGYSPWIVTFNNVIQGLCVEGKVFDALLVLSIMYEGGRATSRVSHNPVIHELNRRGTFLGACSVYSAALKRGVIPNKIPKQ